MKPLFLMASEMGTVSVSSHTEWRNITPVMMGGATYRVSLHRVLKGKQRPTMAIILLEEGGPWPQSLRKTPRGPTARGRSAASRNSSKRQAKLEMSICRPEP
jgi:hypothetical protein